MAEQLGLTLLLIIIVNATLLDDLNSNGSSSGKPKVLCWRLGWTQMELKASRSDWRTFPRRWTKSVLDLVAVCPYVCHL